MIGRFQQFILAALFTALCSGILPAMPAWADDAPNVAGEWKINYPDGSVRIYNIDRHGRVNATLHKGKAAGYARKQNDQWTQITLKDSDELERLWLNPDGGLVVAHFDHKADFPAKTSAQMGKGVRQKDTPPDWASEPNVKISDLAGQWTVTYGDDPGGPVHLYTFDRQGKMRGRECGSPEVALTGHIEQKADRFFLTFNEVDKLERLTLRVDGRLIFEHWAPKSGFPATKPQWVGVGVPVAGKDISGIEAVDRPMLLCLQNIGCSGATLSVGRANHILIARGYGWRDYEHNEPIEPDTPMCTGSCDKPLTMAMIRQLARDGKLDLNASVFRLLQIKPAGPIVDQRVWNITVQHLLDYSAGWQGDPLTKADQAYAMIQGKNGVPGPDSLDSYNTRLGLVMTQRLSWTPGTKSLYDSFGTGMLKLIVTRVSGQSYTDYLRNQLLRPYGINELKWVRHGARQKGEPPQLWNGLILEDPVELRMDVSTPALCSFMHAFWIDGKPRDRSSPLWIKTGAWTNCTSAMVWRDDGINVAWSFNGGKADFDPGEPLWKNAMSWMLSEKKIH